MTRIVPVLVVAGLASCASLEHSIVDATTFESQLPPEVRTLEPMTRAELTVFGSPGIKEFEIGRRFEAGKGGFSHDPSCALTFYDLSGATQTRLREQTSPGVTQVVTYRGFANGRLAARRLRADGVAAAPSAEHCLAQPGGGM